jgi:hypothetical protein
VLYLHATACFHDDAHRRIVFDPPLVPYRFFVVKVACPYGVNRIVASSGGFLHAADDLDQPVDFGFVAEMGPRDGHEHVQEQVSERVGRDAARGAVINSPDLFDRVSDHHLKPRSGRDHAADLA